MVFAEYDDRRPLRYGRSMTGHVADTDLELPLIRRLAARRFTSPQLAAVDLVVVALVIVLVEFVMTRRVPRVSGSGWDLAFWTAYLVAAAVTLVRRQAPRPALTIVFLIALAALCLRAGGPTVFLVVLTLYSVVTTSSRQAASIVTTVVVGSILVATLIGGGPAVAQTAIAGVALILLGWLAGENVKASRRYASQQADRAAQQAAAAAAERAEQVSLALAEERAQIARDLHDIVAHAMSVIAVRSGVARMVIDSDPTEAKAALAIIETTTRRSLHEMRLLVGVLRNPADQPAELSPAPGLGDLDQLIADTAVAGVTAQVEIAGQARPLPPAADVSAYRILQEALTNVVRHARPDPGEGPDQLPAGGLSLEVTDAGPSESVSRPARRTGTGHGLIGMRERAALFGGSLAGRPARGRFPGARHFADRRPSQHRTAGRRQQSVTIKVAIADDQALVRGGFVVLVQTAADMSVVGEAADGAQAVALVRDQHPDVVLMDVRMPLLDGIEATRAITTDPATAGSRVLILTTFDLDDYVYRALRAGASGFLLKDTAPEDMLAAIRTLAAGDALLAPGITRRLIREFAARPEPVNRPSPALLESLSAERGRS